MEKFSRFLGDSVIVISVYKYGMNSRQEVSSLSNTIHQAAHSITTHIPVIPTTKHLLIRRKPLV
jgi:hypothetical protein